MGVTGDMVPRQQPSVICNATSKFVIYMLISPLLLMAVMLMPPSQEKPIDKDCRCMGFNLYGKVKVVSDFPDLKVQIVENFPDIKVQVVENFPDKCGKWKFVSDFPDIKIKFVTAFPDLKIKFVENFPGIP